MSMQQRVRNLVRVPLMRGSQAVIRVVICSLVILVALASARSSFAQCGGSWLPGEPVAGVNGGVTNVVELPNHDLLVAGFFQAAGSVPANGFARFNPASKRWSPARVDVGGRGLTPKGSILMKNGLVFGGVDLNDAENSATSAIGVYDPESDTWTLLTESIQRPGEEASRAVLYSIVQLASGDIVVAGDFDRIAGVQVNSVARFSPKTGTWTALGTPPEFLKYQVFELEGGNLLAVGGVRPNYYDWISKLSLFHMDTGEWEDRTPDLGPESYDAYLSTFKKLSDGRLVLGGVFNQIGGVAAQNIAVYDPDRNVWSPFGASPRAIPYHIQELANGDLLISGRGLARYHAKSDTWTEVASTTPGDLYNWGNSAMQLADGTFLVTGIYSQIGGIGAANIARLDLATETYTPLSPGNSGLIADLKSSANGDVLAGGLMGRLGAQNVNKLGVFRSATNAWDQISQGANELIFTVLPFSAGDALLQGNGGTKLYLPNENVIPYDVRVFNGYSVNAVAELGNGDRIFGGNFDASAFPRAIARLSASNQTWSPLGSGLEGPLAGERRESPRVNAIVRLPDGDLVVAGRFALADGHPADNIARYHATSNSWSALGDGLRGALSEAFNMAILPNGDVVVIGNFESAGSLPADGFARYQPSTNTWKPLGPLFGCSTCRPINAVVALPNSDFIVGGDFQSIGGVEAHGIARFNIRTRRWTSLGAGVDGSKYYGNPRVTGLALLPSGDLMVGGTFTIVNGRVSAYVARYRFASTLRSDFDCSGSVGFQDLNAFLKAYFAKDPEADFNADDNLVPSDIFAFLNAWMNKR